MQGTSKSEYPPAKVQFNMDKFVPNTPEAKLIGDADEGPLHSLVTNGFSNFVGMSKKGLPTDPFDLVAVMSGKSVRGPYIDERFKCFLGGWNHVSIHCDDKMMICQEILDDTKPVLFRMGRNGGQAHLQVWDGPFLTAKVYFNETDESHRLKLAGLHGEKAFDQSQLYGFAIFDHVIETAHWRHLAARLADRFKAPKLAKV